MTGKSKKCLVTEAREKCQCDSCKLYRKFRNILLKQQVELEVRKIHYNALKEAGIIPK